MAKEITVPVQVRPVVDLRLFLDEIVPQIEAAIRNTLREVQKNLEEKIQAQLDAAIADAAKRKASE
jgi:BMFP domain-containing protein YqiC